MDSDSFEVKAGFVVTHTRSTIGYRARGASLQVKGARLFNLVPRDLRDMSGVTVDTFKSGLDVWLKNIPDQPTIPGRQRGALSNSLIDQVVANHQRFVTY